MSKMNDNSFGGKMTITWLYFVNVKENWAHLAEKNSKAGAKITTMEAIMKIFYLYDHKNILKNLFLLWAAKSYYVI